MLPVSILECQLERELQDARQGGDVGRGQLAELHARHGGDGHPEVGNVEEIEGFGAELQSGHFFELDGLGECYVEVGDGRAAYIGQSPRDVAESVGRRQGEYTGVEPLLDLLAARPVARELGALAGAVGT